MIAPTHLSEGVPALDPGEPAERVADTLINTRRAWRRGSASAVWRSFGAEPRP